MKKVVIILLLLIFLPLVSAFEIQNTTFYWNGAVLNTIPYNMPTGILANFRMQYEGQYRSEVRADLSSLTSDGNTNLRNLRLDCVRLSPSSDVVRCSATNIVINQNTDVHEFKFTFGLDEYYHTHTFEIRHAEPEIREINILGCQESPCHVRPRFVRVIEFVFPQEEDFLTRGLLFGDISNIQKHQVDECEGNKCSASEVIYCNEGEYRLLVDPQSVNRYGQRVTGMVEKALICDNTPPEIRSVVMPEEILVIENEFEIEINATDNLAERLEVEYRINDLSFSQNHTCDNKIGDVFSCTHRINLRNAEIFPGTYDFEIIVRDQAGNRATELEELLILDLDETTLPQWSVGQALMGHSRMSIDNLIYSRDSYANFKLVPNDERFYIDSMEVDRNNCIPRTSEVTGYNGDISNFILITNDKDSFSTKFTVRNYQQANNNYSGINSLVFDCPVRIYTRTARSIISQPAELNVTISINLIRSERLDRILDGGIDREAKKIEDISSYIGYAQSTFTLARSLCGGLTAFHAGSSALGVITTAIEAAAIGIGWVPGAGQAAVAKAEATGQATVESTTAGRRATEYIQTACKFLSCDYDLLGIDLFSGLRSWREHGVTQRIGALSGHDEASLDALTYDPFKSIGVAVAQACVPAIITHLDRYYQIRCEYVQCMIDGVVAHGIDPAFCKQTKQMATCIALGEQVTRLILPLEVLRGSINAVMNYITNPVNLISAEAFSLACRLTPLGGRGICTTTQSVLALADSVSTLRSLYGQSVEAFGENTCSAARERMDVYREYLDNPTRENYKRLNRGLPTEKTLEYRFERGDDRPDEILYCLGDTCGIYPAEGFNPERVNFNQDKESVPVFRVNLDDDRGRSIDEHFRDEEGNYIDSLVWEDIDERTQLYQAEMMELFGSEDNELYETFFNLVGQEEELKQNRTDAKRALDRANREYAEQVANANRVASQAQSDADDAEADFRREFGSQWPGGIPETDEEWNRVIRENDPRESAMATEQIKDAYNQWENTVAARQNAEQARDSAEIIAQARSLNSADRARRIMELMDNTNRYLTEAEEEELKALQFAQAADEAREEYEQAEDAYKNNRDERRELERDMWVDQNFGTLSRVWNFRHATHRGVSVITGAFGLDSVTYADIWSGLGFMDNAINWIRGATEVEKLMCQHIFMPGRASNLGNIPVVRQGFGYTPGAYITARMITEPAEDIDERIYVYFIGGAVNPKQNVSYEIYLSGGGRKLDITENMTEDEPRFVKETVNSLGQGGRPVRLELEREYDEVCIEFSRLLGTLFDSAMYSNWRRYESNTICKEFIKESR